MLYQLPNGRTVYLSIEEFLNLTDADIQYLVACNYGDTIVNPFAGSAIKSNSKEKVYDFSDYQNDDEPEEDIKINPDDLEEMQ
jgi:hypothetical protein